MLALLVASACGSTGSATTSVRVTADDDACDVAPTELTSGSSEFVVTNRGSDVTEVYVYGEGDAIKGEVENIGPGTSRSFVADLGAGDYEVACKPGQKGDGIRTPISVTGTTTTQPVVSRTVVFSAHDFDYQGLSTLSANVGETIAFEMVNDAPVEEHEFEILRPTGSALGEIGPTAPGATGTVVLTFDAPGTYTYVCGVADHEAKGMTGTFTASP